MNACKLIYHLSMHYQARRCQGDSLRRTMWLWYNMGHVGSGEACAWTIGFVSGPCGGWSISREYLLGPWRLVLHFRHIRGHIRRPEARFTQPSGDTADL